MVEEAKQVITQLPQYGEFQLLPDFTELFFKKESFEVKPEDRTKPVNQLDLLKVPNDVRGE
jgi:hypothetical protein